MPGQRLPDCRGPMGTNAPGSRRRPVLIVSNTPLPLCLWGNKLAFRDGRVSPGGSLAQA
jgi:hypothetical protein